MISHKKNFIKIFLISIIVFLNNCTSTKSRSLAKEAYINSKMIQQYKGELDLIPKVKEFRKKGINFIAYKSYSTGSITAYQKNSNSCSGCLPNYPIYLIWNKDNTGYIQKIDRCGDFFILEINSEAINYVNKNFKIIKSEKIKFYQENKSSFSNISHSTFKELLISKFGIETYNHFDIYNLSTNTERPNLNFKYNNNLKIIVLNKIIEKQINKLDSLDLFKRDFSTCKNK